MSKNLKEIRNPLSYSFSAKLLQMISNDSPIHEIINVSSQLINNPMILLDEAYELIASTPSVVTDNKIWNDIVNDGHCSTEFLNAIKNKRIIEKVYNNDLSILAKLPNWQNTIIMSKIKIKDKLVAHLGIFDITHNFEEDDFALNTIICNALTIKFKEDHRYSNKRSHIQEYFFTDMLTGKISDEVEIIEQEKIIFANLKKNLFLLTIFIDNFEVYNTTIPYAKYELERIFDIDYSIVFNNQIVILVSSESETLFFANELEKLKKYLLKNKMRLGISRRFTKFSDLKNFFAQANLAIELGRKISDERKTIFYYEDYATYHLLEMMSKEHNLMDFCNPSLLDLKQHDAAKHSEYLYTLFIYLENRLNIVASSELLSIHRNTMKYRLDRIKKILNSELTDNEHIFHYHLSLKILIFMGELNFLKFKY